MGTQANPVDVVGALRAGNREAIDRLVPLLYDELRQIAHRHLASRGEGAALNTTALVNEAYLKLVDQSRAQWNDRVHFLAVAALAMRHILTDRAKARKALKRGGPQIHITLDENMIGVDDEPDALLQIFENMRSDPRFARLVRKVGLRL